MALVLRGEATWGGGQSVQKEGWDLLVWCVLDWGLHGALQKLRRQNIESSVCRRFPRPLHTRFGTQVETQQTEGKEGGPSSRQGQ
jgi:hypothetical protein